MKEKSQVSPILPKMYSMTGKVAQQKFGISKLFKDITTVDVAKMKIQENGKEWVYLILI